MPKIGSKVIYRPFEETFAPENYIRDENTHQKLNETKKITSNRFNHGGGQLSQDEKEVRVSRKTPRIF